MSKKKYSIRAAVLILVLTIIVAIIAFSGFSVSLVLLGQLVFYVAMGVLLVTALPPLIIKKQ